MRGRSAVNDRGVAPGVSSEEGIPAKIEERIRTVHLKKQRAKTANSIPMEA